MFTGFEILHKNGSGTSIGDFDAVGYLKISKMGSNPGNNSDIYAKIESESYN